MFAGQALSAEQTAGYTGGRNPLGAHSPLVQAAWPAGFALLIGGLVAAVPRRCCGTGAPAASSGSS